MTESKTTLLASNEIIKRIDSMMAAHESDVGSILPAGFFASVKHRLVAATAMEKAWSNIATDKHPVHCDNHDHEECDGGYCGIVQMRKAVKEWREEKI